MGALMDDVSFLRAVLSAGSVGLSRGDGAALLRDLLAKAPKLLRPNRKVILFEAMHVLDRENPHSDYLAWLLDPAGPLTENWLLQSLLERVAPDQPWEGELVVEREVAVD